MNLKELTWENHKNAERKQFAKILMSGDISPQLYFEYLTAQHQMYNILEILLAESEFPKELHSVFRSDLIDKDMDELIDLGVNPFETSSDNLLQLRQSITELAHDYEQHVVKLFTSKNHNGLIAHMYVRHFGDMYGGSMIKAKVPGSGLMYEFEDKEALKGKLRELLNDEMAEEANICFEYAIKLFTILGDYDE